jgi:hypothetical protein
MKKYYYLAVLFTLFIKLNLKKRPSKNIMRKLFINKQKNMSMNKLLILSIPLLFLFCRCTNNSFSAPDTPETHNYLPSVADAYVYPQDVTATSEAELRAAYQLPTDILKSISTAGLIRSFLDYPML